MDLQGILKRIFYEERCVLVFVGLIVMILLYPLYDDESGSLALMLLLNSVTISLAIYAASEDTRHFVILLWIGLPLLALGFLISRLEPDSTAFRIAIETGLVALLLFYTIAIYYLFRYVSRGQRVNRDKLFAGLSIYLLLGFAWASMYAVLAVQDPAAFSASNEDSRGSVVYYSFVTLTTLGFGDITPVSGRAKSLSILEAITGVLFLATFVARLVASYSARSREETSSEQDAR
jgi:hypothetical protein